LIIGQRRKVAPILPLDYLQPLNRDQRGPMARSRQAVRPGNAVRLSGLRQERR
jgi:hypothetical protein